MSERDTTPLTTAFTHILGDTWNNITWRGQST